MELSNDFIINISSKDGWMGVRVPRPKKKVELPIVTEAFKLEPKARVSVIGVSDRLGVIVAVGPEVSEVKWDDRSSQIYVPNTWLQTAGK